jgi:hypothetical protein
VGLILRWDSVFVAFGVCIYSYSLHTNQECHMLYMYAPGTPRRLTRIWVSRTGKQKKPIAVLHLSSRPMYRTEQTEKDGFWWGCAPQYLGMVGFWVISGRAENFGVVSLLGWDFVFQYG